MAMFNKILIANRGEIAVRVIRACQEMGISTVAVYSEADVEAMHVKEADEAFLLGDPKPSESYLNIAKIIGVAKESGAQAIHPGYGFLSENADFAQACIDAGIEFIGPSPKVISQMGSKIESKKLMADAGVPVIPGYFGDDQDVDSLVSHGEKIGYPLMVKASAGGGGKGMRIVNAQSELKDAIETARREAEASFGDGKLLLERYLSEPRHIEFQILGDKHGNIIHLFERECSIQRRHQKIIEEAPSPVLTPDLRAKMGATAVKAATIVDYSSAGTVEFMYSKGEFFFLEMNTRLQVEHPITEFTTGIDLVQWQLRIAAGSKLEISQDELTQRGHSIECRIYAEDPKVGFLPSTGEMTQYKPPEGINIRLDSGIEEGQVVSPHYDPMLAKLIVYAQTRDDAIQKMHWALSNFVTLGVTTNIGFLRQIIQDEDFKTGDITTHFIEKHLSKFQPEESSLPHEALVAVALDDELFSKMPQATVSEGSAGDDPHSPWKQAGKWRIGGGEQNGA